VTLKNTSLVSAFSVGFVVMGLALSHPALLVAGELTVSDDGIPTVKVDYSGMNLSTNSSATLFYNQLKRAAAQVCSRSEGRELSLRAQWKTCYDKALSDAVIDVNRPLLTALHQRQFPGSIPTIVASRVVKPRG
jgi:UrcA family protein